MEHTATLLRINRSGPAAMTMVDVQNALLIILSCVRLRHVAPTDLSTVVTHMMNALSPLEDYEICTRYVEIPVGSDLIINISCKRKNGKL